MLQPAGALVKAIDLRLLRCDTARSRQPAGKRKGPQQRQTVVLLVFTLFIKKTVSFHGLLVIKQNG